MKRLLPLMFAALCLSPSAFAAKEPGLAFNSDASAMRLALNEVTCQGLLAAPGPQDPGAPPVVMTGGELAKSLFKLNLMAAVQYQRDQEKLDKHNKDRAEFEAASKEVTAAKGQAFEDYGAYFLQQMEEHNGIDATYEDIYELLKTRAEDLTLSMTDIAHKQVVTDYLKGEVDRLFKLSNAIRTHKAQAIGKLTALRKQALGKSVLKKVDMLYPRAVTTIEKASSYEHVDSLFAAARENISQLLIKFEAEEVIRKKRELRFNVKDILDVSPILEALRAQLPDADWSALPSLVVMARENFPFRAYMQSELQLARRVNGLKQPGTAEALNKRFANDVAVAQGAVSLGTLKDLRRAIVVLNSEVTLRSYVAEGRFQRLNLLEREELVAKAIARPELRLTILNAGLDLALTLAPPEPPKLAAQPSKPKIPSRVSSRSQANSLKYDIDKYKNAVKRWKANAEDLYAEYKNKTVPEYRDRAARLKEAHKRRALARQAFVSYLAFEAPASLGGTGVAINERNARAVETRLANVKDVNVRRSIESRARDEGGGDDFLTFWLMYYYVYNPYWIADSNYGQAVLDNDQNFTIGSVVGADQAPALDLGPVAPDLQARIDELNHEFIAPALPDIPAAPDIGLPDVSLPDTQGLDPAAINDLQDFSTPDVPLPDMTVPDFAMPDMPDIQIPDVAIPDIQIPDIQVPDIQIDTPTFTDTSSNFDTGSTFTSDP